MIQIHSYIKNFPQIFGENAQEPWEILGNLESILKTEIQELGDEYDIKNNIAIHETAIIESNVIIKAPVIIGKECFIGANSYLRNGVFLGDGVSIGIGCEIKSSIICNDSSIAHLNFIGDSVIGKNVNFEGGSLTANHYNERENKDIFVKIDGDIVNTGVQKFGALVGDNSKIGANAVLSPGTILEPGSIVKRLELVEQMEANP